MVNRKRLLGYFCCVNLIWAFIEMTGYVFNKDVIFIHKQNIQQDSSQSPSHGPSTLNDRGTYGPVTTLLKSKTLPSTINSPRSVKKNSPIIKPGLSNTIIDTYLKEHEQRCMERWANRTLPQLSKPLCDCVPRSVLRYREVDQSYAPLNETLAANPSVKDGGHWEPANCIPRYNVAIIVPCRGRDHHLSVFLKHLHPILQGQQLNYTIIIVDQRTPAVFNKGSLMNVGYVYARQALNPDCVIFHDVDIIPQDGRHFYTCRKNALHLGAYNSGHSYRILYRYIFGAVTCFRSETFEYINGFSNRYSGWGGEDDEMSIRIRTDFNLTFDRDPHAVAGYTTLRHQRDKGNKVGRSSYYRSRHDRNVHYDGLNSLRFVPEKIEYRPLYTYISTNLMNDATKIGFNI